MLTLQVTLDDSRVTIYHGRAGRKRNGRREAMRPGEKINKTGTTLHVLQPQRGHMVVKWGMRGGGGGGRWVMMIEHGREVRWLW